MKTEIVKINPEEYGLQEEQVQTIEAAFMPKIVEREALKNVYEKLITGEVSPELCGDAKSLRLKLVKVRTGIAEIHRTQKAYYLAAGRYVDAWKNKETQPVEQMEERLMDIEKYYERIEEEKKAKLAEQRKAELDKYEFEAGWNDLGGMTEEVWNNFIAGVKLQYEQRKEAERKAEEERIEGERLDKLAYQRRLEVADYRQFITADPDLRNMPDAEYNKLLKGLMAEKLKWEEEQAAIREEKKRLEEELQAVAVKAEADRKAREEKERKEREAYEASLRKERAERERIEKEMAVKAEAEKAEEEKRRAEEQRAKTAPDKEKLKALAATIAAIELPNLQTPEAEAIIKNVSTLLDKVVSYVEEKASSL